MSESVSASAYVQGKRLCILGIYDSPMGPIPFSHAEPCETEDGPVNIRGEMEPVVVAAVDQSQKVIMHNLEKAEIRLAAEEIVDRVRARDQNAMALMIQVKKNAQQGLPRARLTLNYMVRYAKNERSARMNGEGGSTPSDNAGPAQSARVIRVLAKEIQDDNPLRYRSAVMAMLPGLSMLEGGVTLSNGPELSAERITAVIDKLDETQRKSFTFGFKNWKSTPDVKANGAALRLGRIFGLARTIQLVRLPNTPISSLSKAAGLELD